MAERYCTRCRELKSLGSFGEIQPGGSAGTLALDGEVPYRERTHRFRSVCRECNARRLRLRRGTQTQEDVVTEIKALLARQEGRIPRTGVV